MVGIECLHAYMAGALSNKPYPIYFDQKVQLSFGDTTLKS